MGMVYQSVRRYTTIAQRDYSEVLQWSAYWIPKAVDRTHAPTPVLIEPRSAFMAITFYVQLDTTPSRSQHPCVHAQPSKRLATSTLMASRRADSTDIEMQVYNS